MHNISIIVPCLRKNKVKTHAQLTDISNQAIHFTDFISVRSEQPGSTYQRGTTRLVLLILHSVKPKLIRRDAED